MSHHTAMSLPAPRPVLWPLRPRETARLTTSQSPGRTVITIEHAPLRGVTPEMLEWWYGHVPGTMAYAGATYPRYLVWHPLDHIAYQADQAPVRTGTRLRIQEALGRDPDNQIDIRVKVEQLGNGRAVIAKRVLGTAIVQLENEFGHTSGGSSYLSRMTIGDTTMLGKLSLNWIGHQRAFPPQRIEPWIRHHVEEIGNLENFLPDLFDARAEHEPE